MAKQATKGDNGGPPMDDDKPVNSSGSRLLSFLERIERLEEEKKALGDDIKDIYAEAKGVGFDAKIMRKQIKRRKMTAEKRQEEDDLLDTYEHAVNNLNSMMET